MNEKNRISGDRGGILRWPVGYAGTYVGPDGLYRCCLGHKTPEEAAEHTVELVIDLMKNAINEWRNSPEFTEKTPEN